MSKDPDLIVEHLAELERRIRDHEAALVEAINARHDYLYRQFFSTFRTILMLLALLGSSVFAFGAYRIAEAWLPDWASTLFGFGAFFVLLWLLQGGSKRKLIQQMQKDAESFPKVPVWSVPGDEK